MEVCSPKDGFVIEVLATEGQQVKARDHVLTIDSDDELRDKARLEKIDSVRALMSAQYQGQELDVNQRVANVAVEIAKEIVRTKEALLAEKQMQKRLGVLTDIELTPFETGYKQALLEQEKAELDAKKFSFAVERHVKINDLVKTYMQTEMKLVETKRERLKILAPINGAVRLRVAVDSFAELGSVLLEII